MAAATVTITVQTDTHSHNGKPCHKGQTIEVDKPTAQFLLRCGVIQKIPASLNKQEKQHG